MEFTEKDAAYVQRRCDVMPGYTFHVQVTDYNWGLQITISFKDERHVTGINMEDPKARAWYDSFASHEAYLDWFADSSRQRLLKQVGMKR